MAGSITQAWLWLLLPFACDAYVLLYSVASFAQDFSLYRGAPLRIERQHLLCVLVFGRIWPVAREFNIPLHALVPSIVGTVCFHFYISYPLYGYDMSLETLVFGAGVGVCLPSLKAGGAFYTARLLFALVLLVGMEMMQLSFWQTGVKIDLFGVHVVMLAQRLSRGVFETVPAVFAECKRQRQCAMHVRYPSGNVYEGEWRDGTPEGYPGRQYAHGTGKMTYANGDVYDGDWKDGVGFRGTMTYANGDVYRGEWRGGNPGGPNGHGTKKYANGDLYEGEWKDGLRQGTGTGVTNGDCYRGEWKKDKQHGLGTSLFASGDIHKGEWKGGHRHGRGKYEWSNGQPTKEWRDSPNNEILIGAEVQHFINGDIYVGHWENDKAHGQGKKQWANGCVYVGAWKQGKRHGKGQFQRANGDIYEERYAKDKPLGKGKRVVDLEQLTKLTECSLEEVQQLAKSAVQFKRQAPKANTYADAWKAGKEHDQGRQRRGGNSDAYEGKVKDGTKAKYHSLYGALN